MNIKTLNTYNFNNRNFILLDYICLKIYPRAGIGRQARLRAECPLGRVGSTPTLGINKILNNGRKQKR